MTVIDISETFDFIVIGSGFGGSVSAMRLTEKGYRVLILERGKRFQDEDFPKTNWNVFKFIYHAFCRGGCSDFPYQFCVPTFCTA